MALAKGFGAVEAAAERAVRPIVEEHGYSLWALAGICEYLSTSRRAFR